MRVHLEADYDYQQEARFSTLRSSIGEYRRLVVYLDGRPFAVWYPLSPFQYNNEDYLKAVDGQLTREFEHMVGRLITIALKIVPAGFDLKTSTDDEIRLAIIAAHRSIP